MKSRFRLFLVSLALALCAAAPVRAQVIYSTDFESFNLAPINGQDGWTTNGTIQNGTAYGGSKALQLDVSGPQQNAKRAPAYMVSNEVMHFSVYILRTGTTTPNGGLSIDGNTGFISQVVSNSGNYYLGNTNSNTPNLSVSVGGWHHLELRLDFGTLTMEGWVDGMSLGTLPINNGSAPTEITQISIFATGGAAGSAVFADDFSWTDVTVPIELSKFEIE